MSSIDKAIGVFDSGLGGISVLKELRSLMPQEDYLYYGDSSFAPYGVKTKEEITKRTVYRCFILQSARLNKLHQLWTRLPVNGIIFIKAGHQLFKLFFLQCKLCCEYKNMLLMSAIYSGL